MKKNLKVFDTNILVRLLTNNHPEITKKIKAFIISAEPESIEITDVVILELFFVLENVYELKKDQLTTIFNSLLTFEAFLIHKKMIYLTIKIFETHNISFLDAYLAAKVELEDKKLVTYDKKLQKVIGKNIFKI